ncbi:SDR family NAD(P)-dependent oxidoreductase [Caulobacter rhizosphaerae]|uniref:NAD(P)-dependent dehydrogenase (Short-subunit alcohol dehydrogenase family) n=1 Tax=Caulobacter rhizosphaerae TaxID=2010972 RepID=A0ABU1N010_9CAUL|nr:glucose 1-dehydrogenase [Caulobacter rhizosphaerae]MDR6531768.1 NAD(P)-dependent dehydrogenase (short-subunit alcohol dehydrogenase family) [Caulobacter rhizosphaerae]GGL47362.1 short-chain dehydrogenase [Caulobacter rhizosphaerae]
MSGLDLTGKVALITGGTRGLGRAMALGFARAGADVIVSSRKPEACEATAAEITGLGRRAAALPCNVGRWDEVGALAEAAWAAFGRLDVLVNNAGLSPVAPSSVETSEALFDKVVAVNFKGAFRLTALVGARMAAGAGGSIINVSSIGALKPSPWIAPYAGAKAALNAMSIALAQEFAPRVRVNVISPGGFLTDIAGEWATEAEARRSTALNRWGDPDEIVGTALYLASDASSYTTGANIRVDGGSFWDRKTGVDP